MDEFESFKLQINLVAYATSCGYQIDRRESSRNSVAMRRGHDKIVVALGYTRKWIYFSIRDDADNGTIIDFIQNRTGLSFGHIRKELRPWIGKGSTPPPMFREFHAPKLEPLGPDREAVLRAYHRLRPSTQNRFLEEVRKIPAAVYNGPRFAGTIYRDERANTVFPHHDRSGVTGFEIKNTGFTGFSKHGTKALWFSVTTPGDERLVIAETAIDAISFHALHGDERTRYCSIAGKMNASQPGLLAGAMAKLPAGGQIVAAMDNDRQGRALAGEIEALFAGLEDAPRCRFAVQLPREEGADWNDVLECGPSFPTSPGAAPLEPFN